MIFLLKPIISFPPLLRYFILSGSLALLFSQRVRDVQSHAYVSLNEQSRAKLGVLQARRSLLLLHLACENLRKRIDSARPRS